MSIAQDVLLTTSDGQKISCSHYNNASEKVIIIAHGFFNSKDAVLLKDLGQEVFSYGYDVLMMDFRGHGKSTGLFYWTAKEPLDLMAVLDFAKERYRKIGVIGFSLGAATSIVTASRVKGIDSLIAISPPISFSEIEFHFWECHVQHELLYTMIGEGVLGKGVRPGPLWLKKDNPIDCMAAVACPTMFLHGDIDWVIRHRHSVALYAKAQCKKELVIVRDGPHAEYLIQRQREQTIGSIRRWLSETL